MMVKLLVLDHFGQEMYETNVCIYGLCHRFHLTIFMGTPNSMRISDSTSLLTESGFHEGCE
jgi:hypothetical protein